MEDGSLDVDDLFGDPNSLDLGLPAAQPTKGLAQRLDEMRLLGCCQYVHIHTSIRRRRSCGRAD